MTVVPHDVVASGFRFCEAPCVGADGDVFFSDLVGGGYHAATGVGAARTVLPDRRYIGGAVLDESGALLLSGEGGIVALDSVTGATRPVLTALAGCPIIAVNDIEADAAGGLYGGTIDFPAVLDRGEVSRDGVFFRLDPSGEMTVLRDDVVASNGMGFSPDGRTLYHAETTVGVWAWTLIDGCPHGPPRLLLALDDCDGLAVDAEGAFWVAFWREGALRRYRPDGTVTNTVALAGVPHIVSVCFGADRHSLYVTTGADERYPAAGGLVRIRVGVPGLKRFRARLAPVFAKEPVDGP